MPEIFENLDIIDKLLLKHNLPKLTQGEIENQNSTITIEKI